MYAYAPTGLPSQDSWGMSICVKSLIVSFKMQVEQQYLVTSMADQAATLLAIIERHRLEDPNHKVLLVICLRRAHRS